MKPNQLEVGDTVALSGMGEGVITGFTERGFPQVNHVACAYLERTDGVRFDPYGVAPWNKNDDRRPPRGRGDGWGMSNWPAILGRQLKLMVELESRFKSGNSVPVERTYLTRTEFDGLSEYMLEEEDISTMSGMANMRLQERVEELEIACAQAVEFAEYVEGAAKGKMAERARHYLSLPYSQELAKRLLPGREAGNNFNNNEEKGNG